MNASCKFTGYINGYINWAEARRSYRHLVQQWHPDRFSDRPREKQLAQNRFVEITSAYNNLREFHREHSQLPLQDLLPKNTYQQNKPQQSETPPPAVKPRKTKTTSSTDDLFEIDSGRKKSTAPSYWLWAIPLIAVMAILTLLVLLEKRLAQQHRQSAVEVLEPIQSVELIAGKYQLFNSLFYQTTRV